MHIFITGASGSHLGKALIPALVQCGHQLTIITRNLSHISERWKTEHDIQVWDFNYGPLPLDKRPKKSIDVILNLMRENLDSWPWSKSKKEKISSSLVKAPKNLLKSFFDKDVTHNQNRIITIDLSSIHYYGENKLSCLPEGSGQGTGFLSEVFAKHEKVIESLSEGRFAIFRVGYIFSGKGGPIKKMERWYEKSLGVKIGWGHRLLSWIHEDDLVQSVIFAINTKNVEGIYNLVAPEVLEQKKYHEIFAEAKNKRQFLMIPTQLYSLLKGEQSTYFLKSIGAYSKKIQEQGFVFEYPMAHEAFEKIFSYKSKMIL